MSASSLDTASPVYPVQPVSRTVHPVNRVSACYQCQKCTAGCPVAPEMDLAPHEVALRLLLGEEEAVLRSSAIWLCVGCEVCGQRCPNGVSLGQVMPELRQLALKRGVAPREVRIAAFHAASSASVRERGRLHEAAMLLDYARRAFLGREGLAAARDFVAPRQPGGIRDDARVGLALVARRKLPLRAAGGGPAGGLKELFEKCKEPERR